MYEKTVSAALSETQSKFALAEALAIEIPPRGSGARAKDDDVRIPALVAEARTAVIDAGGEPRAVSTLQNYRDTAIWVMAPGTGAFRFRWIPGVSFTAHNEARERGLTYDEFAASPRNSREIRREYGQPKFEPLPQNWDAADIKQVAQSLSPEQATTLIEDVLQRDEVRRDSHTRSALADASIKNQKDDDRARETKLKGDKVGRRFESGKAHDDLKRAIERFADDAADALQRITDEPYKVAFEDLFLPDLVARWEDAVEATRYYLAHGKTDTDAFVASLSKE